MTDMDRCQLLSFREVVLLTIPYEVSEDCFIDSDGLWRFSLRTAVENVSFY